MIVKKTILLFLIFSYSNFNSAQAAIRDEGKIIFTKVPRLDSIHKELSRIEEIFKTFAPNIPEHYMINIYYHYPNKRKKRRWLKKFEIIKLEVQKKYSRGKVDFKIVANSLESGMDSKHYIVIYYGID